MTPKSALELLVAGLNRAAFNPLEIAGINQAVTVLKQFIDEKAPPPEKSQ